MQRAKTRLSELADRLGLSASEQLVETGSIKAEIIRVAQEQKVDLIVLGSRERHGIAIMVNFTEFAASSLNINLYCFTKTTDWAKYRAERQDIFLKCIEIIARHGAECAFPTTTIYMEGETHVDIAGRGNHAS